MQAPFFLIVPPSIINVLPHSVHTVVAVLCTSWAAVRAKPRRSVLHTGQELLLTLPRVCATSFFIGPCHGNWACGGALVVTVRGWRNWRMLGLHPGETLVTLLPTFCCSVPRGVSFFFFSRFCWPLHSSSRRNFLWLTFYQKEGCFPAGLGG